MNYLIIKEHYRKGDFSIRDNIHSKLEFISLQRPVIGMISSSDPNKDFNFTFDCYKEDKIIGYCSFQFSMMQNKTLSMVELPIKDSPEKASITFKISWILPFRQELYTANPISFPMSFVIGHRGSGQNAISKDYLENSLNSFKAAINKGAQFVEFDIQMSKDGIPVIHHDFHIESRVPLPEIGEPVAKSKNGNYLYAVKQFTKDQFVKQGLKTSYQTEMATLEDLLTKLPPSIGFDAEVKYPCYKKLDHSIPYEEMNKFVDAILEEMIKHAGDRRIFFSSFDPLIVIMLKLKQRRWPVFQLFEKTRKESIDQMVAKIRSYALIHKKISVEGFVGDSNHLMQVPYMIKEIKDMNFMFFTYGDQNLTKEGVHNQLKLGINGICTDSVPICKEALQDELGN